MREIASVIKVRVGKELCGSRFHWHVDVRDSALEGEVVSRHMHMGREKSRRVRFYYFV